MVDIEPYEYQRKTNLKEHNDLVAKINEIVDVINNTNLDTVIPRIAKIETDISGINSTDALQWQDIESVKSDIGTITPKITKLEQDVTDINSTDAIQNTNISNLKTKDSEHDTRLGTIDTEIDGINKSLVSDVAILNGTTSGNVKVRIGRKDAPSIDSDDYNIQKPTSVELIQGSAPAMVKAQITLSDGTVLISDDFMFTTEAIGQDVYISSFVFKNGNVAGTISADIGLSNGSTLTANNFAVPTDPNVTNAITNMQGRVTTVENDVSGLKTTVSGHTTSINGLDSEVSDLQTRITAVEGGSVVGFKELKATVDGHTASISALDSDVADLQIDKADVNNNSQSIVAGSISANNISKGGVAVATVNDIPDISGKVDIAQGIENRGKALVVGTDGNVTVGSTGKSIYTGSHKDLVIYNSSNKTEEIITDFDIEYIYVDSNGYVSSSVAQVKKQKFLGDYAYIGVVPALVGNASLDAKQTCRFIINGNMRTVYVVSSAGTGTNYGESNPSAIQLTTDETPKTKSKYYFRIYT